MALIVEDGTGLPTAESYISVADATTYHIINGTGDDWDAVDDKEAAMRKATAYMTQAYRLRWKGMRAHLTQRLDWPRLYVPILDAPSGYGFVSYVNDQVVPEEVKAACAILALQANSGVLNPNLERQQQSVKVGEIAITYEPNSKESPRYKSADMTVGIYLESSGAMSKLVRT